MKGKGCKFLALVMLVLSSMLMGQTTLNPGEVVILEFNGNGNDGFTFMPLVDLAAGTQISFTDYGWDGSAFLIGEDGTTIPPGGQGNMITYTAPSTITAGTLIRQNTANIGGGYFTATPDWAFNFGSLPYIYGLSNTFSGHDGIIVFQGTPANPTFIWAHHTGQWGKGSYGDYYWSNLPTGLINGTNAIFFADLTSGTDLTVDDGFYSGSKEPATKAEWRARVANADNWTTLASGTAPALLYPASFSVTVITVAPTVTTQAVSAITSTTATGNGNITDLGTPNPTAHGVCWNTTGTPTISDSKVDNGAANNTGAYTAAISGLNPVTQYYVRAYATNSTGTNYGEQVLFTTTHFAGGTGTEGDPYQITNPDHLNSLRNYLGDANSGIYYKLMNDIDLSAYLAVNGAGYNNGAFWNPIATTEGAMFKGKFDGSGYSIKNLKINLPGSDNTGLFGYIGSGTVIKNVNLINADVNGKNATGALVGANRGGSVINSSSSGSVYGVTWVGGL